METISTILAAVLFIILLVLLLGGLIYALSDRIYRHLIMRIVWTNRALEGTDEEGANPSAPSPAARQTSTTVLPKEDLVAH